MTISWLEMFHALVIIQINASLLGHRFEALPLQGLNCFGAQLQPDKSVATLPPQLLHLQVGLLKLLRAVIREGDGITVVASLSGEVTNSLWR